MSFPILTDNRESPGVTFADPGSTRSVGQVALDALASVGRTVSDPYVNPQPYADIFHAAERSMRLTGNIVSEGQARAEAYDQRIKAAKVATGIDLENPERGGYAIDARKAIAQEVRAGGIASIDAKGGIPEYQRRIFDQKLAELQKDHPELQFGDADAQARAIAKGATEDAAKTTSADVNPVASLAFQFAGGLVGARRDPLFVGSLFAGPTTAVGRTALARVASSSLFSGLYNAGVSAAEQPAVQDWRARIGVEHGVLPAMQDVGLAFLMGAIPGAGIQAIKESARASIQRVLAGHPEPGDIAAVHDVIPLAERDHAALQAGEESVAADKATLTIPTPKGTPEPLHNDMLAAALKRADDPAEPSPAAVEAVRSVERPNGFMTAKGSEYQLHDDGTTTRNKAARSDPGHEGDFGQKPRSEKTVYVDPQIAAQFNPAPSSPWRIIDHEDGTLSIAYQREDGRWGISPTDRNVPVESDPRLGLSPIELWKPDQTNGLQSYRGVHPGNEITEFRRPKAAPPEVEQRIAEAAPKTEAEAHVVADEALDDMGRNAGMTALRDRMAAADAERAPPVETLDALLARLDEENTSGLSPDLRAAHDAAISPVTSVEAEKLIEPVKVALANGRQDIARAIIGRAEQFADRRRAAEPGMDREANPERYLATKERLEQIADEAEKTAKALRALLPTRTRGDVLDKVPWVDGEGRPKLLGAKGAAAVGERETTLSMLVRSCK